MLKCGCDKVLTVKTDMLDALVIYSDLSCCNRDNDSPIPDYSSTPCDTARIVYCICTIDVENPSVNYYYCRYNIVIVSFIGCRPRGPICFEAKIDESMEDLQAHLTVTHGADNDYARQLKGHLLAFSDGMGRNVMQSTERNRTKGKFSFHSVRLEVTVGRFLHNCSYPFRLKVAFQAERFKLLAICSIRKGGKGIRPNVYFIGIHC
uniref:Uncharacterized protein n=1 Tax=Romanomermis culicivorax TaxID=13658 RepID=A0A915L8C6_ROMCU